MARETMDSVVTTVEVSIDRLPRAGARLNRIEEDLAWLDQCWELRAHVATIWSASSVGKSWLVSAWLDRLVADGYRGAERVYGWSFSSPGAADDPAAPIDEFMTKTLEWFGDRDSASGSLLEKADRLVKRVRRYRAVLVLDGVEAHQEDTGDDERRIKDPALWTLVRELATKNTGLCIITTRARLADLKEHRVKCPQLFLDPAAPSRS